MPNIITMNSMVAGVRTSLVMGADLAAIATANFQTVASSLVTIQGETFMMGGPGMYGINSAMPIHETTVSTFRLQRTSVTNQAYRRFAGGLGLRRYFLIGGVGGKEKVLAMAAKREDLDAVHLAVHGLLGKKLGDDLGDLSAVSSNLKVVRVEDYGPPTVWGRANQPVTVNWYSALIYANLNGMRLPTEAERELAARVVPGRKELRDYATPSGRLTRQEVHYYAVDSTEVDDPWYPTLENGLRHMTGNVDEWLSDWWGSYPAGSVVNPTGPAISDKNWTDKNKTVRGGSFALSDYFWGPWFLLTYSRHGHSADERNNNIGFRCAVSPHQATFLSK